MIPFCVSKVRVRVRVSLHQGCRPGAAGPARLSAPDLEPGPARLRARLLPGRPRRWLLPGKVRPCSGDHRELAARPTLIRPLWVFARYTRPTLIRFLWFFARSIVSRASPKRVRLARNASLFSSSRGEGAASGISGLPWPEAGRPPQPGRARPRFWDFAARPGSARPGRPPPGWPGSSRHHWSLGSRYVRG